MVSQRLVPKITILLEEFPEEDVFVPLMVSNEFSVKNWIEFNTYISVFSTGRCFTIKILQCYYSLSIDEKFENIFLEMNLAVCSYLFEYITVTYPELRLYSYPVSGTSQITKDTSSVKF